MSLPKRSIACNRILTLRKLLLCVSCKPWMKPTGSDRPTAQLNDHGARWYGLRDALSRVFENVYLRIGEIVFIQIRDLILVSISNSLAADRRHTCSNNCNPSSSYRISVGSCLGPFRGFRDFKISSFRLISTASCRMSMMSTFDICSGFDTDDKPIILPFWTVLAVIGSTTLWCEALGAMMKVQMIESLDLSKRKERSLKWGMYTL